MSCSKTLLLYFDQFCRGVSSDELEALGELVYFNSSYGHSYKFEFQCYYIPKWSVKTLNFSRKWTFIGYGAVGALIFSLYIIYDTQLMMGGKHLKIGHFHQLHACLNWEKKERTLWFIDLKLFSYLESFDATGTTVTISFPCRQTQVLPGPWGVRVRCPQHLLGRHQPLPLHPHDRRWIQRRIV